MKKSPREDCFEKEPFRIIGLEIIYTYTHTHTHTHTQNNNNKQRIGLTAGWIELSI